MNYDEIDPEEDDVVTVFVGDLHNCRERLAILADENIPSLIAGDVEGMISEYGPPVLTLQVRREDMEDVVEIFEEVWLETLDLEGLDVDEAIVDLSSDSIVCPGCQSVIDEVTADGECPECSLYLGFPEESSSDDDSDTDEAYFDDEEY